MSETSYSYLILITPFSNLTLPALAQALRKRLEHKTEYKVLHMGRSLAVIRDNWQLWLLYNDAPSVAEESRDLAEEAHPERRADVSSCGSRLEMGSDPDPEKRHFQDSVYVIEVLEKFEGILIYDLNESSFLSA